MRFLRLALPALAFVAAGSWATHSTACDDSKASARTATARKASSTCTAQMAAQCTPEMAAACRAHGASATAAVHSSCSAKASAVTASTKSSEQCPYSKMSAAAYAASMGACGVKSASSGGCSAHGSAATASAKGHESCGAHNSSMAATIGAAGSCNGRGMSISAGKSAHGDCDACADMAVCYEELESAGTRTQVVPLKNGVMFVYTAESPGRVSAVQAAMARRGERLAQIIASGDKAHLCPECKTMRGAMASGKMTREVVNIEGGALTLMTSNDPAVVAKIHAMIENHRGARSKT
jgi:hypothetical protein